MASPGTSKGIVVTVPALSLSASVATILLFLLFSTFSSCSCPSPSPSNTPLSASIGNDVVSGNDNTNTMMPLTTTQDDVDWVKNQIQANGLHMHDNVLRKGINPRTRAQQLDDLTQYKGISHYEGADSVNHMALPCLGELLVEQHHSNYGEPWAGGRDVFEFLAQSIKLRPDSRVLEIGCGTLRVGSHFIWYLNPDHYHCLERDELSLMAISRYELPSQGLLYKRPLIVKGDDMDFSKFGSGIIYDLIYASAVFLHMPDKLVWVLDLRD